MIHLTWGIPLGVIIYFLFSNFIKPLYSSRINYRDNIKLEEYKKNKAKNESECVFNSYKESNRELFEFWRRGSDSYLYCPHKGGQFLIDRETRNEHELNKQIDSLLKNLELSGFILLENEYQITLTRDFRSNLNNLPSSNKV